MELEHFLGQQSSVLPLNKIPSKVRYLVVEVVHVLGDKHMDVPHDLQHIQTL